TGTQGLGNASKNQNLGIIGILNYDRTFNEKHTIAASMLASSDFNRRTGELYEVKYHHLGTRLNYMFDNKYIIDFSSALTSALHLAKGNRTGYSPSVALGWIISNEEFFKNIGGIDYLKLKASNGILK